MHRNYIYFQYVLLAVFSIILLYSSPEVWNFSPDSGIFIGTTVELLETGHYWFNGAPNLQYYPGLSVLLAIPISIFGVDFHVLHLVSTVFTLSTLWICRAYFSPNRYEWIGYFLPLVLMCSGLLLRQAFSILSDGLFLGVALGTLFAWRNWIETNDSRWLVMCIVFAMYAPLLRFQGLFIALALPLAYLVSGWSTSRLTRSRGICLSILIGSIVITPFVFWTARNYFLHTPDTFNLANNFFFGLQGLPLYGVESLSVPGIDADWKYTFYRSIFYIAAFGGTFLGSWVVDPSILVSVLIIVVLIFFGGAGWWERATWMERFYVLFSVAYILKYIIGGGRSFYVVPRYWIPVAPFLLVMVGYGLAKIDNVMKRITSVSILPIVLILLLSTIGANGVFEFMKQSNKQQSYVDANRHLSELATFTKNNISTDAVVATTDWGVLPYYLRRRSILVINDKNHLQTIKRMKKYNTTYLAVMDGNGNFPRTTRNMVSSYPDAFEQIFSRGTTNSNRAVDLYKIDLIRLQILSKEK